MDGPLAQQGWCSVGKLNASVGDQTPGLN